MKYSAFNLSAVFFVVCVLAASFAVPTSPSAPTLPNTPNLEQSVKQISAQIEKSLSDFNRNSKWIYHHLQAVLRNALEQGFANLMSWALELIMRLELIIMADGSHFMFPHSDKDDMEEEYRTVAIAVSELLRHLKSMERTDALLTNVTKTLVDDQIVALFKEKVVPVKIMKTLLYKLFETVDQRLEADNELAVEYKKLKVEANASAKRGSRMHDPVIRPWDQDQKYVGPEELILFLQDKVVFRQVVANKIFLKEAVKHLSMVFSQTEHRRYLLARALIRKAATLEYDSQVNELYQRALVKAGEVRLEEDDEVICDVLFHAIDQALESEPQLHKEIVALTEEIDRATVYDIDMLRVDFSSL